MSAADVIAAWDQATPGALHPTRGISEDAYWASGRRQADILAQDIPVKARVMDFGCGDGRVAIPLRALGYDVLAVDSSPRMLASLAVNAPDLPTVQSDGTDLAARLGRRKMAAVVCISVLIHYGYKDGARLVANLRAVTRKGGLLILDWPVSDKPSEGGSWISVTTWDRQRQDDLARELKMERVDVERPWSVWRAV